MPTHYLAVDRFEGRDKQIAVLVADAGRTAVIPRDLLPSGTRGGEVLLVSIARADDAGAPGLAATPIDLNAGSAEELQTLPGVGPVLAKRLIAGRPYAGVDDLARVEGLGGAKLDRIRQLIRAGPTPGGAPASPAPIRLRIERPAAGPGGAVRLATEDGREVVLPSSLLPGPAGAGGYLALAIERDQDATRKVVDETRAIQEELFGRDPGGDLKL